MKQNSFISVILTVACSLMFVACSDWTEPTPVDYNPIFPDEQDHSLYEKYEQSLKEYKNRKHTLMLIRFASGYPKFLPIMDNKGVGITNLTLGIRRLSYPAEEYQLNAENMLGALRKLNGEDNGATRLWWDCNPNVK